MDPVDFHTVKEWFKSHDPGTFTYTYRDDDLEDALELAVDFKRIDQEIAEQIIIQLGNDADDWLYVVDSFSRIRVCNPNNDTEEACIFIRTLVKNAMEKLKLYSDIPLFNPCNTSSYKAMVESLAQRAPLVDERLRELSHGKLPDIFTLFEFSSQLEHRGKITRHRVNFDWGYLCGDSLDYHYLVHALHRSGNFLKPGAPRRKSVDLCVWWWED